jgi:hypothetical protein
MLANRTAIEPLLKKQRSRHLMVCLGPDIIQGFMASQVFMMRFDSPNFLVPMVCEVTMPVPERKK